MAMPYITQFTGEASLGGLNKAVNTWHVLTDISPTVSEAQAMITAVKGFYDAAAATRTSAVQVTIGNRTVYWSESWWTAPVAGPPKVPGHFTSPPVIMGTTTSTSVIGSGGTGLPNQLAQVVSWRTAFAGRSFRGRTFLGPVASTTVVSQIPSAAVTAANTAAGALITAMAAISIGGSGFAKLCIWSPTLGHGNPVVSGNSDSIYDTLRSRVK